MKKHDFAAVNGIDNFSFCFFRAHLTRVVPIGVCEAPHHRRISELGGIAEAVAAYLDTLGMRGDTVRCAHVETAILSVDGIIDVTSVTLNGADSNVTLTKTFDAYQLPVLGDVTLQEGS